MDMTLSEYLYRGGLESALERHANKVFQTFTHEQKRLAQNVFSKLVEIGPDRVNTRRTATFTELVPKGIPDEVIAEIVNRLAAEGVRLITTSPALSNEEEATDNNTATAVTLAHEKLIDAWPWLRQLVDENRDIIRIQNEIAVAAKEWESFNRNPGLLYRGAKLQQALEWYKKNEAHITGLSARFLGASREEVERAVREKEVQRQRELAQQRVLAEEQQKRAEEAEIAAIGLKRRRNIALTLAAAAFVLAIAAFLLNEQAQQQTDLAQWQTNLALSSALVSEAQNVGDQELRMLLALEAVRATTDEGQAASPDAIRELEQAVNSGLLKAMTFAETNRGIQFSPDGKWLALQRSNSGTARLINVQTLVPIDLPATVTDIDSFEFGATGQYIAASGRRFVHILDAETLQVYCPQLPQNGTDTRMVFNSDESLLYTASLYTASVSGSGQLRDSQSCELISIIPFDGSDERLVDAIFIGERQLFVTSRDENGKIMTHWDLRQPDKPVKADQFRFDGLTINLPSSRLARSEDDRVEVIHIDKGGLDITNVLKSRMSLR